MAGKGVEQANKATKQTKVLIIISVRNKAGEKRNR